VIAGAVYCNRWLYLRRFNDPTAVEAPATEREKTVAVAILVLWAAAITAGRLTAYDSANTQWQTALGTLIVSAVLVVGGYAVVAVFRVLRNWTSGRLAAEEPKRDADRLKPQRISR
jgi:hypothetical protein